MSTLCPQTERKKRVKTPGAWKARRVGPYSREGALSTMDGRTREARYLRETRRELEKHLGGAPSATQRVLIDRAAMLRLHIAQLDAKALAAGGAMTDHDRRSYLAFSNSLDRAMRTLGLAAKPKPVPRPLDLDWSAPRAATAKAAA